MKIIHTFDSNFFGNGFFDSDGLAYTASITSWSSTKITFTNSETGAKTHLSGIGFSVDGAGNITSGTITKFTFKASGVKNAVWKDMAWSGTNWQAVLDEFAIDEYNLFDELFTGDPLIYDASDFVSTDSLGLEFEFFTSARPLTFIGSDYNDNVLGSIAADTISGGNGRDLLGGFSGDDTINGGGGKDMIYGHNGHDKMYGGTGDDRIFGASGNDRLEGGNGKDVLKGGNGHDKLNGGKGDDKLSGSAGSDKFIFSGPQIGADIITDFTDDVDTLKLDSSLWGGGLSKAEVISTYTSVVAGDVVFDFGSGQTITLTGVSDTASLLNDLVLI